MTDRFEKVLGDQPRGREDYEPHSDDEVVLLAFAVVEWLPDEQDDGYASSPAEAPDDERVDGNLFAQADYRAAIRQSEQLRDELAATHKDRPGHRKRAQGYVLASVGSTEYDIVSGDFDWSAWRPD